MSLLRCNQQKLFLWLMTCLFTIPRNLREDADMMSERNTIKDRAGLVKYLKKLGATDQEISATDPSRLDDILNKIQNKYLNLEGALRILSMQQVLGLSKARKVIDSTQYGDESDVDYFKDAMGHHVDNLFDISPSLKTPHIRVVYIFDKALEPELNSEMYISVEALNKKRLKDINDLVKNNNVSPKKIVHDWYLIRTFSEDGSKITDHCFCPSRKLLLTETYDKYFPKAKYEERDDFIYGSYFVRPYYEEKHFYLYLANECKTTLDDFRVMPGMSDVKIAWLARRNAIHNLMYHGLTLSDIANADAGWLKHIIANEHCLAQALKLCDKYDVLGIEPPLYMKFLNSLPTLSGMKATFMNSWKSHPENESPEEEIRNVQQLRKK